jgi:hypothetical protein
LRSLNRNFDTAGSYLGITFVRDIDAISARDLRKLLLLLALSNIERNNSNPHTLTSINTAVCWPGGYREVTGKRFRGCGAEEKFKSPCVNIY